MRPFSHNTRLLGAAFFVGVLYCMAYLSSYTPPLLFLFSIILIYAAAPPSYIFHPKNILFAYYFIWYTLPVMYATRYEHYTFREYSEIISYCMLIATFLVGYLVIHFVTNECLPENIGASEKFSRIKQLKYIPGPIYINLFLLSSILSCFMTMVLSGYGITGWLTNPGLAFQERSGSGMATILLIFFSGITLTIAGYQIKIAPRGKKLFLLLLCFLLILFYFITLMHRSRLFTFFLLLFLADIFYLKMKMKYVVVGGAIALLSVYVSSLFREAITENQNVLNFLLNYFDTYDALVQSVKYEEPHLFSTTFMAFKKLYLGMGYDPSMPYTISQWLTPKYFPGYGVRTTVQFPIETEMYLNGYYVLMLPFLLFYFYVISKIYRHAFLTSSLGALYASAYIMILMIGTLRGMFIDFTLFYNIPLVYISYLLLNRYQRVYPLHCTRIKQSK